MQKKLWLVVAVLSILFAAACGGGGHTVTPPADPPPVLAPLTSQTIQVGNSATFNVVVTSGTPPFTFAWTVNGSEQSDDADSLTISPNSVGTDTVSVTVSNAAGEASESTTLVVQNDPPVPTGFVACGYNTEDPGCSNTSLTVNQGDSLTWLYVSSPTGASSFSLPPTQPCVFKPGDVSDQIFSSTPCWTVTDTQGDPFVAIMSSTTGPIDFAMGTIDRAIGGATRIELPSGLSPSAGTLFLIDLPAGTIFNAGSWPYCPGGGSLSAGDVYNCATLNSTSLVVDAAVNGSSFQYNLPTACYGSGSNAGIELSVIVEDGAPELLAGTGSTSELSISGSSENALVQETVAISESTTILWNSSASLANVPVLVLNLGFLSGAATPVCN